MTAAVRVTTDLDDIDLDVVHRWLSEEAYWALGRSRDVVEPAARASVNFGALDADGRLVGYARVVTDQVTFAWLCDVFVDPAARGLGAGKALAGAVVATVRPMGLKRVMLATADAHELYRRFGFEGVTDPEKLMILARPSAQRGAGQEAV
jgi:N-acetylglutamate synthase-like GNAT family acetyltransferase